jgi:hypothetical protein
MLMCSAILPPALIIIGVLAMAKPSMAEGN